MNLFYTSASKFFSLAIASVFFLTSCSHESEMISPVTENTSEARLAEPTQIDSTLALKQVASFPIGAAFSSNIIIQSPKAYNQFITQFNSKTVQAYMKVEPVRGQFNFKEADYWVKLAQTNPMRLHGHVLVYHAGAPDWLLNFSGSTADFEQAIKNHIQTIVSRYKGKIKSWDVINEAFYNSGEVRETAFRKLYTSDAAYLAFVKRCFQWAHEADPNALLFYSDFDVENNPAKVQAIINMVNDFKRSGVRIDGFGSHMHIAINTSDAGIENSLRQLSTTGLQIHISELDIKVNPKDDKGLVLSEQLLNTQRAKYHSVAQVYKRVVPQSQQYGITLWDLSDGDSWIVRQQGKHDAPCVLNASYDKKAAFYGLIQGLK